MTPSTPAMSHLSEGDLVRILDRQAPAADLGWMTAHVSSCGECAGRVETLRSQSEAVSRYVGSLDSGVVADDLTRARALVAARGAAKPAKAIRVASYGWMRAAAAIAVVAVGALGIQPVRAWVADQWAALTGEEVLTPAEPATPSAVLAEGSVVSFEPAGDVFVLEIRNAQAVGDVHLRVTDVPRASATVMDGADEAILVLPSGVRIENADGSTASYSITLPSTLRLVQVFADGKPIAMLPVQDSGADWSRTVPLSPR